MLRCSFSCNEIAMHTRKVGRCAPLLVFIVIIRAEKVCRVLLASKTLAISTERAVAQLTIAEITSLNEVHATVGLSSVGFHTLVEYATN